MTNGERPSDRCEQTISWPMRRFRLKEEPASLNDIVIQERRIELTVNGTPLLALLALPRNIEALALGFLVSEGIWRDRAHLPSVAFDTATNRVDCCGRFDDGMIETVHRRWTFGSCGGGGGTVRDESVLSQLHAIHASTRVTVSELVELGETFSHTSELFRVTGAVHSCAVASCDRLLVFAEDIGRHNAFDKVAGLAIQQNLDLTDKIVLTSGRISAEIVGKAVVHRIPILASSAAPTAMGLQWARQFALTIVGFLRDGRMNVYTAYDRIIAERE